MKKAVNWKKQSSSEDVSPRKKLMENNYFSSDERIIKLEEGLITEDLTEIIIHKSETIHSF